MGAVSFASLFLTLGLSCYAFSAESGGNGFPLALIPGVAVALHPLL